MPSIKDIYPDTYLKPEHLRGRNCLIRVQRAYVDKFWNPRKNADQPAIVIRMQGKQVPFILNKTQCFAIATILGTDDYTQWQGGKLRIKPGIAPNQKPTIVVTGADTDAPPAPPSDVIEHPDADDVEQHPDTDEVEQHPDAEDDEDTGDQGEDSDGDLNAGAAPDEIDA